MTVLLLCRCEEAPAGPAEEAFPLLTGDYFGQTPPGDDPQLFAPGLITTGMFTRDVAITPDGDEIYYCVAVGNYSYTTILFTRRIGGRWTEPEVAPHMDDPEYMNLEPCISSDGKKFFFLSTRPDTAAGETEGGDQDIWVMDRTAGGWGEPYNPGPPVNTEAGEFFPSVTRNGTLYFTRNEPETRLNYIYRARLSGGAYAEPERLPEQVNTGTNRYNAFIDPDERYIIVPAAGREDSLGGTDYYIVFRHEDDTWSDPVNMGDRVNTEGTFEFSPCVSPDGRYFFFMSSRPLPEDKIPGQLTYRFLKETYLNPQNGKADIYWVDARFIDSLRPENF
jgi:hypothetical protein